MAAKRKILVRIVKGTPTADQLEACVFFKNSLSARSGGKSWSDEELVHLAIVRLRDELELQVQERLQKHPALEGSDVLTGMGGKS